MASHLLPGDPVPSPSGDCLDGHGELVGGGLHVQAHGLPQVSTVILHSYHPDYALLQDIWLLRIWIYPHCNLLRQVMEDFCSRTRLVDERLAAVRKY